MADGTDFALGATALPSGQTTPSSPMGLPEMLRFQTAANTIGPLVSQGSTNLVEQPVSTSPTGSRLGDLGIALSLMGAGLQGDVLPTISVLQQMENRRRDTLAAKQRQAERQAALQQQQLSDALKVATSNEPWAVRKKMLGQMADNSYAVLFGQAGDEKVFGDFQAVKDAMNPDLVQRVMTDPQGRSGKWTMGELEADIGQAMKYKDAMREQQAVEQRVNRVTQLMEQDKPISPLDKEFYIEWAKKKQKTDEEFSLLQAQRRKATSEATLAEEKEKAILGTIGGQPVQPTQPSTSTDISQGQRDVMLGLQTPAARAEEAKKEADEFKADLQAAGIDPASAEGQRLLKVRAERKAMGTPLLNLDMSGDASKEAQKKFMDKASDTYQQLKTAPAQLENLEKAKKLIPTAKGFLGPGGETLLDAAKFFNNRFGFDINPQGIKSAEELRTRIFFNVLENLKKMDAQPSQYQQIIMMDAFGNMRTDPSAISHMLDAYGDFLRARVDLYNTEVQSAEKRGVTFPYDPVIKLEQKGRMAPAPSGLSKPERAERFKRLKELQKR